MAHGVYEIQRESVTAMLNNKYYISAVYIAELDEYESIEIDINGHTIKIDDLNERNIKMILNDLRDN